MISRREICNNSSLRRARAKPLQVLISEATPSHSYKFLDVGSKPSRILTVLWSEVHKDAVSLDKTDSESISYPRLLIFLHFLI